MTGFPVSRWQIRRAIVADTSAGHALIVAEHQQLEAHLLAHLAACPALAASLSSGAGRGDFAALAASVFPHIKDAIASGENTSVLLMQLRQLLAVWRSCDHRFVQNCMVHTEGATL